MPVKKIRSKRKNKPPEQMDPMQKLMLEIAVEQYKERPDAAHEEILRGHLFDAGVNADFFVENLNKKGQVINFRG